MSATVLLGSTVHAETYDAEPWRRVLENFQVQGGLDYRGLQKDRADLDRYLELLSTARPDSWSQAQQLAFWSNAYNAVVAHHVLDRYPGITSVKAEPGFFDEIEFEVAGQSMTLDEIETAGRDLGDARVHFAVVCASTSCPDLQPTPFEADALDSQLESATRQFLADPSKGLRFEPGEGTIYLSSIFKWYAGDFTGGSTVVAFFARGSVLDWVLDHLPTDQAREIHDRDPKVRYLEYDWSLNDRPR